MAGHNKWSSIKHKKAKEDNKRGKIFSKIARELMVAAKIGADPDMNARLRLCIQKAKEANMPSDNITRAIEKGAGGGEGTVMEENTYEAYGPHGVAFLIDTLTDNKNRTVANVRHILTKANGSLAAQGSVSYLFNQKGLLIFEPGTDEEKLMEIALSANAEDIVTNDDGSIEVQTAPGDFEAVKLAIDTQDLTPASAAIEMIPSTYITLDQEQAESIVKLVDTLEDDDDVQNVYGNFNLPDNFQES